MNGEGPSGEDLRAAAAILHAAEGSRLLVGLRSGRLVSIGSQPHDVASSCELRRAVADPAAAAAIASSMVSIEFGGCFVAESGPVLDRYVDGAMQHWFVTPLCPFRVESLLHDLELSVPCDEVDVRLVPDSVVGLTVGHLSVAHPVFRFRATDAAIVVAGRLEVERLLDSVTQFSAIDEEL